MPAVTDLLCDLCAEPCEVEIVAEGRHFCCAGCRNVYSILVESGVVAGGQNLRETELFRRSLELGLVSTRVAQPTLKPAAPTGLVEERTFHVGGMWCSSCAWLIEHVLMKEAGVQAVDVFFTSDILRLKYAPQSLPFERIATRLSALGYTVSPCTGEVRDQSSERRSALLRIGIAAFLWINVMMLNLGVYFGFFDGLAGPMKQFLPFLVMALSAPVVFYCAIPVLRAAWAGLRVGVVRMEALLSLGILAAWLYSSAQAFVGGTHIYFDISCAIVTLVLLGKHIERNAKEGATRSISMLYQALPVKARVLADGRERFTAIEALHPGDIFLVKSGERVPADGVVLEGSGFADESILTGESRPVPKNPGDTLTGGSLNTGGILRVRTSAVGSETALAQIVRSVEAALTRRSGVERAADRVSRLFVPLVIALAVAIGIYAAWTGMNSGDALMRAITVLVIACPCALGISTPLAITAAVGAASRRGILIPDTRALERVPRIDTVLLDKTGTVTEGSFSLLDYPRHELATIAALEAFSEHPLGRAVTDCARADGIFLPTAQNVEILKGRGIRGDVSGIPTFCGNRALLAECGSGLDPELDARAREWEHQGATVAFFGSAGRTRGLLAFGDRVRPDAAALISELRSCGLSVELVSGDSRATTAAMAKTLGLTKFHAEVRPEEKQRLVTEFQDNGIRVAMVGDGVNDAPALAHADLGIAMGSGTALAMKASSVVLMTNELGRVLETFALARRTLRVIRQNLFWSFVYNSAGIYLAATGRLNPIIAAGAMITSSLFVIGNSSRLTRLPDGTTAESAGRV